MLVAGHAAEALKQYEVLAVLGRQRISPELRYRIALCAESLGDCERALAEYRTLLGQTPSGCLAVAARLGQVRVWMRLDRGLLAKQVLWQAVLEGSAGEDAAAEAKAEFTNRLAQMLVREARHGAETALWKDAGIADPLLAWSPEQMLLWVTQHEREAPPDTAEGVPTPADEQAATGPTTMPAESVPTEAERPRVEILRRLGPRPEETYVLLRLPPMPAAEALEQLLRQAGLTLHWSDDAREMVSRHRVQLGLEEVSLAVALDSVLDPCGLVWEADDASVHVHQHEELPPEASLRFRRAIAQRMLRHALVSYPAHEMADEALWSLGNLEFDDGRLELAVRNYEEYLRQFPEARSRNGVHFNLAKAFWLQGRRDQSQQHFYHVVDAAVEENLLSAAHLYLGRLYLDDDRAVRAVKPLTRASALAQDPAEQAVATLALATAYLLCGNPHSANRVLMDHREALEMEPTWDHAALLAALSRFQAAQTEAQQEKEGRALIAALTHVQAASFWGGQDFVIAAEAFCDLGMPSDATRILADGLQQSNLGRIRWRMLYDSACARRDIGDLGRCRELLVQLQQEGNGEWARIAALDLAELAFERGDDEECLRLCHQLLEAPDAEPERNQILRTIGRVYERQGNYHGAALCFAGVSPRRSRQFHTRRNEGTKHGFVDGLPNAAFGRDQIRISKSEIRNKFKTRNPNVQNTAVHLREFWNLVL